MSVTSKWLGSLLLVSLAACGSDGCPATMDPASPSLGDRLCDGLCPTVRGGTQTHDLYGVSPQDGQIAYELAGNHVELLSPLKGPADTLSVRGQAVGVDRIVGRDAGGEAILEADLEVAELARVSLVPGALDFFGAARAIDEASYAVIDGEVYVAAGDGHLLFVALFDDTGRRLVDDTLGLELPELVTALPQSGWNALALPSLEAGSEETLTVHSGGAGWPITVHHVDHADTIALASGELYAGYDQTVCLVAKTGERPVLDAPFELAVDGGHVVATLRPGCFSIHADAAGPVTLHASSLGQRADLVLTAQ